MHHHYNEPDVGVEEGGECEVEETCRAEGYHVQSEYHFAPVPFQRFEFLTEYLVLLVLFAFALLADHEMGEMAGEVDGDKDITDAHPSHS